MSCDIKYIGMDVHKECCRGGSEHERPICDPTNVSLPERTHLVEVGKGHRPENIRRCSKVGTSPSHARNKIDPWLP
jgi:hypothetical protein